MIGLTIGMGMWWNYFDILGRRVPGQRGGRLAVWLYAHLPLTMAIAASGAAMVSLVEHAADSRTPASTAWLLSGSVALMLAGVALAARALPVEGFPPGMAGLITPTFLVAAAVTLVIGATRPAPIVLVAAVSVILALTWFWLFVVFLALGGVPMTLEESGSDDG
jgi:low temperature requirement protein LtrA